MAQVINTNVMSLNAQRNLNSTNSSMQQSIERLSSGLRINSAADDAAGLAISERFTSQIKGQDQAIRNANDGLSFAQTAEGALDEVGNMSQRIRELAVQSANDSNSQSDREAIDQEVQSLIEEVDRIAESTQFNGQNILNGALDSLSFQVGSNEGQTIEVDGVDSRTTQLGAVTQGTKDIDSTNDAFNNNTGTDGVVFTSNTGGMTDGNAFEINGESFEYTNDPDTVDLDGGVFHTVDDLTEAIGRSDAEVQAVKNDSVTANLGSVASTGTAETVTINDSEFTVIDDGTGDATDVDQLAAAINNSQLQTEGVKASVNDNNELEVTSSNGDAINVQYSSNNTAPLEDLNSSDITFEAGFELQADVGTDIKVTNDSMTVDDQSVGLNLETGADTGVTSSSLDGVSVGSQENASQAITTMDFVISQVSSMRSNLGAAQNRMESTISNLEVGSENLSAARSRIQDADFAKESSELTRNQVLQQAGTSMLAQANQVPQNALSLLQ